MRKQSRARRLLRGARNVPCLCCHIISQAMQWLFQLLNSLQSEALRVDLELCTVHSIIYSHVAALPSKITRLHGGTNAWTHGQTTFRANRQYNLLVCFSTQKYTIRSIVCEASCHLVTQSLGHLVTRSLVHWVIPTLFSNITTD